MLGLMSTEQFKTQRSLNSRRRVFYQYPNGAAPLTGLLSLMETEEVDKPEFGWFEKRMNPQKTTAAMYNAAGPFATTGDANQTTTGWSQVVNTIIRIKVADTSYIKPTHVIWVRNIPTTTANTPRDIFAVVNTVVSATVLEVRLLEAVTNYMNDTTANGVSVLVIGSANPEGGYSGQGLWTPPYNPKNYTEIFRSAFGFSRTALKAGVLWDKTGIYKDTAKENAMNHMQELEKAFLFGTKTEYVAANADGDQVPTRTTGGVLWFMRQWELGTPYGVDPATDNNHPNKRIIVMDPATPMTKKFFNSLVSRVFKTTNNRNFEKLVFCGNTFLGVINEMFEGTVNLTAGINSSDTYGMTVTKFESLWGTLYFKTHPLFNLISDLNASALILDIGNLKYHPLSDSDTTLLKNRQANDADRRKDEWLTEGGLECQLPDSHMFIDGVTAWEP